MTGVEFAGQGRGRRQEASRGGSRCGRTLGPPSRYLYFLAHCVQTPLTGVPRRCPPPAKASRSGSRGGHVPGTNTLWGELAGWADARGSEETEERTVKVSAARETQEGELSRPGRWSRGPSAREQVLCVARYLTPCSSMNCPQPTHTRITEDSIRRAASGAPRPGDLVMKRRSG